MKSRLNETKMKAPRRLGGKSSVPIRIQGRIPGCHTTGDLTPQEKFKKTGNPWNSLGPKMSKRNPVKFGSSNSDANGPVQFHLTVFVYVIALSETLRPFFTFPQVHL